MAPQTNNNTNNSRKRSPIWRLELFEKTEKFLAKCNACQRELKMKNRSIKALKTHLNRKDGMHAEFLAKFNRMLIDGNAAAKNSGNQQSANKGQAKKQNNEHQKQQKPLLQANPQVLDANVNSSIADEALVEERNLLAHWIFYVLTNAKCEYCHCAPFANPQVPQSQFLQGLLTEFFGYNSNGFYQQQQQHQQQQQQQQHIDVGCQPKYAQPHQQQQQQPAVVYEYSSLLPSASSSSYSGGGYGHCCADSRHQHHQQNATELETQAEDGDDGENCDWDAFVAAINDSLESCFDFEH